MILREVRGLWAGLGAVGWGGAALGGVGRGVAALSGFGREW